MIAYLSQYLGDFCDSDFCFVDFFSGLWLWDSLGCWLLYSGHELHRLPFGQQAGQEPLRLLDFPLLHTAQLTGSPGYILSEGHHLSLGFFLFSWFPTLWPSFIAPPFFPESTFRKKMSINSAQTLEVKGCIKENEASQVAPGTAACRAYSAKQVQGLAIVNPGWAQFKRRKSWEKLRGKGRREGGRRAKEGGREVWKKWKRNKKTEGPMDLSGSKGRKPVLHWVIHMLHGNCLGFLPGKAFRRADNMKLLVFSLFRVNFLQVLFPPTLPALNRALAYKTFLSKTKWNEIKPLLSAPELTGISESYPVLLELQFPISYSAPG